MSRHYNLYQNDKYVYESDKLSFSVSLNNAPHFYYYTPKKCVSKKSILSEENYAKSPFKHFETIFACYEKNLKTSFLNIQVSTTESIGLDKFILSGGEKVHNYFFKIFNSRNGDCVRKKIFYHTVNLKNADSEIAYMICRVVNTNKIIREYYFSAKNKYVIFSCEIRHLIAEQYFTDILNSLCFHTQQTPLPRTFFDPPQYMTDPDFPFADRWPLIMI